MSESSRAKLAGTELKDPLEKPGSESLRPSVLLVAANKSVKARDMTPPSESSASRPDRIAIKTKGKILLINPADILAVEAEGNYVLLRSRSDTHPLRESISAMAEKLKGYGFLRIHRSVLVNASWVEEIRPGAAGESVLRIAGGGEYVVSRTYKNNLKLLAHSWIGTDSFVDE